MLQRQLHRHDAPELQLERRRTAALSRPPLDGRQQPHLPPTAALRPHHHQSLSWGLTWAPPTLRSRTCGMGRRSASPTPRATPSRRLSSVRACLPRGCAHYVRGPRTAVA